MPRIYDLKYFQLPFAALCKAYPTIPQTYSKKY